MSIRTHSTFRQEAARRFVRRRTTYQEETAQDFVLVGCGIFETYVAVFDSSIFQLITGENLSSRVVVSAATILAAGIPFFFALGAMKDGAVPSWRTVFFYERLLKGASFWAFSGLFLLSLIPILFLQGRLYSSDGAAVAGLALCAAAYLFITARRRICRQL